MPSEPPPILSRSSSQKSAREMMPPPSPPSRSSSQKSAREMMPPPSPPSRSSSQKSAREMMPPPSPPSRSSSQKSLLTMQTPSKPEPKHTRKKPSLVSVLSGIDLLRRNSAEKSSPSRSRAPSLVTRQLSDQFSKIVSTRAASFSRSSTESNRSLKSASTISASRNRLSKRSIQAGSVASKKSKREKEKERDHTPPAIEEYIDPDWEPTSEAAKEKPPPLEEMELRMNAKVDAWQIHLDERRAEGDPRVPTQDENAYSSDDETLTVVSMWDTNSEHDNDSVFVDYNGSEGAYARLDEDIGKRPKIREGPDVEELLKPHEARLCDPLEEKKGLDGLEELEETRRGSKEINQGVALQRFDSAVSLRGSIRSKESLIKEQPCLSISESRISMRSSIKVLLRSSTGQSQISMESSKTSGGFSRESYDLGRAEDVSFAEYAEALPYSSYEQPESDSEEESEEDSKNAKEYWCIGLCHDDMQPLGLISDKQKQKEIKFFKIEHLNKEVRREMVEKWVRTKYIWQGVHKDDEKAQHDREAETIASVDESQWPEIFQFGWESEDIPLKLDSDSTDEGSLWDGELTDKGVIDLAGLEKPTNRKEDQTSNTTSDEKTSDKVNGNEEETVEELYFSNEEKMHKYLEGKDVISDDDGPLSNNEENMHKYLEGKDVISDDDDPLSNHSDDDDWRKEKTRSSV